MKGALVTIRLTIGGLGLGLILGIPLAFGQVFGNVVIRGLVSAYERVVRSIPLLVILFLIFYGFPNLGIKFPPFVAAVLGIGLRSAAYQSQIFRGAIQSVSGSQFKAGLSLGMNYFQVFWHVILPQAIRISIPPFANEAAIVLKDTSLAFALGVIELLRQGRYIISTTYQPLLIFSLVAAIYFIMTFAIHRGLDLFEARMQIPGIGSGRNVE